MQSRTGLFGYLTLLTVIWLTLAGIPAAMAATSWQTFKVTDTGGQKSAAPVVVDSNGAKHTAWVSGVGATTPGTLYYASSSGLPPQVIATTADENSPPSIFVTSTNDIYVTWLDKRNGPNGDGTGWDI